MSLLPVEEALARLLAPASRLEAETVAIGAAAGRILAAPLHALRTQPPFAASAMDGYAVRASDLATIPAELRLIGTAPAGSPFAGRVGPGEAVRIFTGAPVPDGADAILIQENAEPSAPDRIRALESVTPGRYIRPAGLDFRTGDLLLPAGSRLDPARLALAAAANHASLAVVRRPRVAIIATGDELLAPGSEIGPGQIIASNSYGVAAIAAGDGAEILDLGIVGDAPQAIAAAVERARAGRADILITLGGASVGDHDLVGPVLKDLGMKLDFWRIAMRPGKPLMVGRLSAMHVLGLPGNPVSSLVCAHLFLRPLIARLLGTPYRPDLREARLATPLPANDGREDYLRAVIREEPGGLVAEAFSRQDSSMLRVLAEANGLIIRPPRAPALAAGSTCRVLLLRPPCQADPEPQSSQASISTSS